MGKYISLKPCYKLMMRDEGPRESVERGFTDLKHKLETVDQGDHLCCIYEDKKSSLPAIALFVLGGLEQGEKCLYIVDDRTKEDIIRYFKDHDIDIDGYLEKNQIEFLTRKETYLKDGYFDPDEMIDLLKRAEKEALDEGYRGLRVTGEMTWVLTDLLGTEKLMEYEAKLNKFLPGSNVMALCQYNEKRFSPEILTDVLHTHPRVLLQDRLFENPFYLPPDPFLAQLKDDVKEEHYEKLKDEMIHEEELARKERLAMSSLDAASVEVYWVTPEGQFIYTNEKVKEKLGYSREEFQDMYVWDVDPNYPRERREKFWKKLKDKKSMTLESRHMTKEGETFPVEITTHHIERNGKEYEFAFVEDITERKRIDEELREEKERFRSLAESSSFSIFVYRKKFLYVNPRFEELLGYSKEELLKMNFWEVVSPNHRELVKKRGLARIKGDVEEPTNTYELKMKRKDGKELWVLFTGVRSRYKGKTAGLGAAIDITERKEAKEELKELTRFRERIINDVNIWLNVLDEEGNILVWNKAAEDISGYTEEEVVGHDKVWKWLYPDEEYLEEIKDKVQEILAGEKVERHETKIITKKGEEKVISWNSHPLMDDDEEIIGSIAIGLDITKQKEAEERKEFLNTLLRQDLKGKNQTIEGYLQLLEDTDLEKEQKGYLEKAIDVSADAEDILELAKELEEIEETDWTVKKDIFKVLEHAVDEIEKVIEKENITIVKKYDEEISKVRGDYSLTTLFSRLLKTRININWCKRIEIDAEEKEKKVVLKIDDDGEKLPDGIKILFLGKLYTGFTAGAGGVMYYMIKQIAKSNNADIQVGDSELGGASFSIELEKAET